jgi:hypothetical protein
LGSSGFAQSSAEITARIDLISQAQRARSGGDHTRSLDLAERAGRISMTSSLRRFITEEQMALGRTVDAYASAQLCLREAAAELPSPNRDAVARGCTSLVSSLESRIGRIVVNVPQPTPHGLHVTVAGSELRDALWGVDYVVSPGSIAVDATAAGLPPFHRNVQVAAGGRETVSIELVPTTAPNSGGPIEQSGQHHVAPREPFAPRPIVEPSRARTIRSPLGPVLMAAGGAALITGVITTIMSETQYHTLMKQCPGEGACTMERYGPDMQSIQTLDVVSTVTFIAGAGLLALGTVFLFTLVHTEREPSVSVGLAPGGLTFSGRFF